MRTKIGLFAIFSLFALMILPVYAEVTTLTLEKNFYIVNEKISFSGTENEGRKIVTVIIKDNNGNTQLLGGFSDSEGKYETIPQSVGSIFSINGIYNVTAFDTEDRIEEGVSMQLEFDGEKVFEAPDFVLQLRVISDYSVEVEKTITFTASLVDSSVEDAVFSLDKAPSDATIDPSSGKFVWAVSKSYGSFKDQSYSFDIVVNSGAQEDRENITITVKQTYVEPKITESEPETKELQVPAPFVDETKEPQSYVDRYNNEASYKKWFDDNYPEYASIYEAVGLEEPLQVPAPFVDETKEPQSYVDRYNNEASYKKWFDDNYPEYASIYEAVGLIRPLQVPAPFVDETKEPQSYVDRYNNEASYKKWFDDNYPEYASIYEAVGLEEPIIEEPEFGECGEGTKLIDGKCTVVVTKSKGGGCLIATAAYGSEMAPQVQFLREIRDNQLMNTDSGVSFMTGFNQVYYSFSPTIADMQRENPIFKEAVRIGITPLLSSLSIMSHAESESEVLGYGIGVILMNIGMYFGVPAMLFYGIKKVRRVKF